MIDKQLFQNSLRIEVLNFLEGLRKNAEAIIANPPIKRCHLIAPVSKTLTAQHINNGGCADFAHSIWEIWQRSDEVQILSDEDMNPDIEYSHTFLEFQGLYYDAECTEGVKDWTQLPIFLDENRVVEWWEIPQSQESSA